MTLEKLNSYAEAVRELKETESLLASMEAAVLPGAQVLTGMPHSSGYSDKLGKLVPEIADARDTIACLKKQLAAQEKEVMCFISSLPNCQTRIVFRLRFLRGLTWTQIAAIIGGKNTSDSVRMICNRYFE